MTTYKTTSTADEIIASYETEHGALSADDRARLTAVVNALSTALLTAANDSPYFVGAYYPLGSVATVYRVNGRFYGDGRIAAANGVGYNALALPESIDDPEVDYDLADWEYEFGVEFN